MGIPKLIAIDGVNFCVTHRSLGVREINYKQLIHLLAHTVGKRLPYEAKATINPDLCHPHRRLFCDMKNAGIIATPAKSYENSSDDAVVKDWLNKSCSCPDTREVVLITCDHDIIEEALWLTKWHLKHFLVPVHMYIIATAVVCKGEHCPTSRRTLEKVQHSPNVHFVEMSKLVHQAAYRAVNNI